MDKSEIVQAIMNQIDKNVAQAPAAGALTPNTYCGLTEYVGTAPGDTIGLGNILVDLIHDRLDDFGLIHL